MPNDYTNVLERVQQNSILREEYFSKYILGMINLERSNFVFTTLGKAVEIPKNFGTQTISFRRYNSLPVSADLTTETLAEGIAPDPLKIEAQKVQGTISQFGAYIEITDVVGDIHMDDIKTIYMPELSRHAAEVVERDTLATIESEASEYRVAARANDDAILADDVLTLQEARKVALTQKNYRRGGHAKFGGKPVLVVHINVMQDLLDDDDLEDRVLVPGNDNSPIKAGHLEQYKVYGMYIIETLIASVAPNTAGTVVNIYTSYMLGKEPYAVIKLGGSNVSWHSVGFVASHAQPLAQKATFGYKLWTGAKVLDPIAITCIYSASAYDTSLADDFSDDPLGRSAIQVIIEEFASTGITGSNPGTETGTAVWTAALLDDNGDAVVAADFDTDAYIIVWTSATVAKATVAWTSAITATITGVDTGDSVITATLKKRTAAGLVTIDSATKTVTVPS